MGGSKIAAGVASGSSALIADGVHSITDLVSDAVTFTTLRFARRQPDSNHLWGHGRFEPLGTLAVGTMLMGASWAVMSHSYDGLNALEGAEAMSATGRWDAAAVAAVAVATVGIASKEVLFRWTARVAEEVSSSTLLANAWHHRADAWSSIVALVGTGGTLMGLPVLDPLGGLLVGVMVGRQGVVMAFSALRELSDEAADAETEGSIQRAIVGAAPLEILSVRGLRSRVMGHYVVAEAQVTMRPEATLSAADAVKRAIALEVTKQCPNVHDLSISVSPHGEDEPLPRAWSVVPKAKQEGEEAHGWRPEWRLPGAIEEHVMSVVMEGEPLVRRVTHIRLHFLPGGDRCTAELEIDVKDPDLRVRDVWRVAARARRLAEQVPEVTVADVHLELRDDPRFE